MSSMENIDDNQLAMLEIFNGLAAETDEFERYANPHAARVATIADQIGKSFHLGARDRFSLRVAALAHDLGEVAMGREYVRQSAALTSDERLDLARHPLIGEHEAASAGADRGAQ